MTDYATISDLHTLGIPAEALARFSDAEKLAAITEASSEADSYLSSRYTPPFSSWPKVLSKHVSRIAVYTLMSSQGFNPDSDGNELIVTGQGMAIDWLTKVSKGIVTPPIVDTSPLPLSSPQVISSGNTSRGW